AGTPAERLDVHAERALEPDRVGQVPAVHAEPLLAAVAAVGAQDLVQAQVGGAVGGVALAGDVEVPRPAEVVLGAGAADRRELLVAVEVELHLALAPPAARVRGPREVGADVVAPPGDALDEHVRVALAQRVVAA